MLRVHRLIGVALATLALIGLSSCTYDSSLTDLQCENEGEIDGSRICQDGIWVQRAGGGDSDGEDAGDTTPPEDTTDVEPPEDVSDTSSEDVTDTTTDDVTDAEVEDVGDATADDAADTTEDTATEDATDTATDDATDTVEDTIDPDAGDAEDTGGPCFTPATLTNDLPLGYWPLDAPDTNGEYPHAGSAPFGPAVPSSHSNADPINVPGVTGNAVEMDGDRDYLKIDHHPDMLIPRGTVVFWMKVDAFNGVQGLWSKDASGNPDGGHLTLEVRNDQKIHVRLQSDSSSYTIESQVLQPDQWIHVALSFGPTNTGRDGLELFVDGASVASNAYVGGLSSNIMGEKAANDEPIGLGVTTTTWDSNNAGAWPSSSEELDGLLDEVALFDRRLTPQEIGWLANSACQ